ncbi:hypothetical protein EW145_g2042 [Phellinidium pouzarii]|uniref:Uncharacterized protein n=1 Tax=Phellinidium pouzarii TaxID=167371 RepID=A0A4S4LE68_9AGAM|nr:hypothetical protein EW145_g2042 [Phellinidium pouzarii]
MGNFIWHEWARFISLTAAIYAVWAGYFGIFYRKFFWDFVGGTLRDPGGLQPAKSASFFIAIIVKAPILQVLSMILGAALIALEWPLPVLKKLAIHRSLVLRPVLLLILALITILFYQGTNVALYSFVAAMAYGRAMALGEKMEEAKENRVTHQVVFAAHLTITATINTLRASESQSLCSGTPVMVSHTTIITRLEHSFAQARDAGDLLFYPSSVHTHEEAGIEFEIRLCPALQNKARLPTPHFEVDAQSAQAGGAKSAGKPDPFAPPYVPNLLVGGNDSGASQPHKHIQFIPVDNGGPPIERLARGVNLESISKAFSLNSLPFATHIRRLPALSSSTPFDVLEDTLGSAFMALLDLTISTARLDPEHPAGQPSYNVLLSQTHMYAIPRRREEHILHETGDALSVNALGFAGMLLVKNERELEAVKKEGAVAILRDVGLASVHGQQIAEAHELELDS